MPELPEVEAARRAIEDHCIGKRIVKSIVADDAKVIDGVSAAEFEAYLFNKSIVAVHRKGKNMWIQLDAPPFPSFQFGMAGAIYIKGVAVTKYKRSVISDTDEWPSKYSKVFIMLDDGLQLSFTDKRRFAKVRLLKDPASVPPISELGPDAFLELLTADELHASLSKKKVGIKALLLDQSFLSGIGNWIADEVLYQARIHPMQIASTMSKESSSALYRSIKEVIEKAVGVGADSDQYPSKWIFHSREMKPGKAFIDGKQIDFITAGGRTTAYVPEVQKLSGSQASKPPAKISKQASRRNKDRDADSSDDDGDDDGSEIGEESKEKLKSKRGHAKKDKGKKNQAKQEKLGIGDENEAQYKSRNQRVKAAPKRKSHGSDEDGENNGKEDTQKKKPRVDRKKASAKSKTKVDASSEVASDDDSDRKDQMKSSKVTKGKQPEIKKSSKEKVETTIPSRRGEKPR